MADRSFTLIGNFTDNISPSIKKVNVSLGGLKRNLETISRLTSPLKNDFKDLASHSRDFASSLKSQSGELKSASAELRRYKSELQQIVSLQRSLGPLNMGGGRGGRGGGGGGYGGGGARGPVARDASYAFGQILGNQVAGVMTNAITQGFQIGVGLMQKPFQYFASALGERIKDEQSDIKAAGGVYSVSMRQNKPFVKTFAEAMKFTQENNKYMAVLAGALPGDTQQYIEVFKRLSDSISRTVMNNTAESIKLANKLRADPNRTGGTAPAITDMGAKGIKQAITEIGGELTKKTVLAGLGGGSAGGVAGAYGLPQLTERLQTQQEVTMGQFRRYAAIFRDPMISDALERYIPKINATVATSAERTSVILKMFDEILPPEVVRAFQRSTSGIIEQFKTMLIGPEVGFLGLGRKMGGLGKAMNDFGEYVDKTGKVVTSAYADPIDLSIFDLLRDIFANFGLSLAPIVEFLPTLFDPLRKIGESLSDLRNYSGTFFSNFTYYKNSLIKFSEKLKLTDKAGAEKIAKNLNLRAILLNINNAFRGAGIYGYGEGGKQTFAANAKKIVAPDFDPAPMLKSFIETFMNSDAAYTLGKNLGTVISVVLQQVSGILNQIVGVANAGKLVSGFEKGFGKEGKEAVSNIIRKVFQGIAKALYTVFQAAPLEFTIAGIATLGLPALMGALSTQLGLVIEGWIDGTGSGLGRRIRELGQRGAARFGNMGKNLRALPGKARALPGKLNPLGGGGSALGSLATNFISTISRVSKYFTEFGNRFKGFFSGFLGKFAIFGAILNTIGALLSGKDFATALASGAGPLLGAALGFALLPFLGPIGPMIGAAIGNWIGSTPAVIEPLAAAFRDLWDTVVVTSQFLVQMGVDLQGVIRSLPGVGRDFDLLRWVLSALLSPFTLLKLAMLGIYEAYLNIKEKLFGRLTKEEEATRKSINDERRVGTAELQNRLDVRSTAGQIAGVRADIKKILTNPFNPSAKGNAEYAARVKANEMRGQSEQYFALENRLKLLYEEEKRLRAGKPTAATGPRGAATPAQKPLQNLATSATNATKGLDKTIKVMPPAASTGVAKALSNMSTVEASAALAKKIGEMPTPRSPKPTFEIWKQGGVTAASGSLGDALHSEMRNKPSGSSLVIANSSETVIPAAGGLGMSDFMKTLHTGFYTLTNHFKALGKGLNNLDSKTKGSFDKVDKKVSENKTQTQTNMSKMAQSIASLTQKVGEMNGASMMMGGGYGSGGVRIAGMLGNFIKMTGGAPGSIHEHPWFGGVRGGHSPGSYHYSGRAIDIGAYANEQAGVISRIMAFNRKMGVNPVEFLHAGNRADHQDHVHVAYAYGPGNGLSFSSASEANKWEKSKVGSATVKTFTTNSREMAFGGGATINAPISIYQQPGQDPEELAAIVVARLSMAVESLSNYV